MVYKFIERSKGVVIFSVSLIAFGTFCTFLLTLSIALIWLKDLPQIRALMPYGMLSMPFFWLSSFFSLCVYISWIICGIGALHLKDWARQYLRVVMAVYLINLFVNIYLNIFLAQETMSEIPVGFLVVGIMIVFSYYLSVIYFFSHPDIVRQFKYKSREY